MRLSLALSLGLLASACSDLECPRNSTRKGDTCHECPEGTWPKDNVCTPTGDAGAGAGAEDANVEVNSNADAASGPAADGSTPVPRAENVPTLGGFSTVNDARKNSANSTLSEDGFELGPTLCNPDGRCLTGSFAP